MAWQTSEGYKEVIYSGDAKHKLKLLFNGVEYETANVKTESVKITSNLLSNGNERFSLDNFVSKEAEIIIHDIDLEDIIEPISISIGTLVNNEYEYVPMGIFNLQGTPTTDNGKTIIKLRDNSVKFDYPYDASKIIEQNGGSVSMKLLLQDMCNKFEVELGTTSFINEDTRISVWDNTINARQYIMYIAEKAGCIASIDRLGKLILVNLDREDVKVSVLDNIIYINSNFESKLKEFKVYGKSEQDGIPTPTNPQEIKSIPSIENLFVPTLKSNDGQTLVGVRCIATINEDTFTLIATGTDIYVGRALQNGMSYSEEYGYLYEVEPNTTYTFFCTNENFTGLYVNQFNEDMICNVNFIGSNKQNCLIFTTQSTTKYVCFRFGNPHAESGTSYSTKIQFEKSATAHPYVPYGHYLRIENNDESIFINIQKENLFKGGDTTTNNGIIFTKNEDDSYDITGTATYQANVYNYVDLNESRILNNEIYTICCNQKLPDKMAILMEVYNGATWVRQLLGSTNVPYTGIANISGGTQIRFGIRIGAGVTVDLKNLKIYLVKGYKLYHELCSTDNEKDELDIINGKGVKRIEEIVLTGNENWMMPNSNAYPNLFIIHTTSLPLAKGNGYKKNLLCSHFKWENFDNVKTVEGICVYTQSSEFYIRLNKSNISTVEQLKTWLSNNPVTIQYELAKSEEFEIEPVSIELYEGTNNISLVEDIETKIDVTYQQNKTPIELNPLLFESYVEGEKLKISRVVYEDAIRKFEYGNENNATLYVNSANPYIVDTEEVKNIYDNIKGFNLYSMKISKMIGNPALDSWDLIEFTYNNKKYKTLAQNILTYNGVITQSFDTQIGTEAKSQENVTKVSDDAKFKRVFTRIDQAEGNIELNTSQITNIETDLKENHYTKEQSNILIQNAATGVTNTFSEAGGNNIFKNTGLWYANDGEDKSTNPYEFWEGNVIKNQNSNSSNMSSLLLQKGTVSQNQIVADGNYTVSFKYKKLIPAANCRVIINNNEYNLDSLTDKEFVTGFKDIDGNYVTRPLEVKTRHIEVQFISDTNNACEIYDLMVNAGSVKLAYSQNQNETTTETVNISKGITIKSSDTKTTFKANADGIRTLDNNNNEITSFTDTGMTTKKQTVEEEAVVVDILMQRVGNQVWFTKI